MVSMCAGVVKDRSPMSISLVDVNIWVGSQIGFKVFKVATVAGIEEDLFHQERKGRKRKKFAQGSQERFVSLHNGQRKEHKHKHK